MAAEIQVFLLSGEIITTTDGFNLIGAAQNEILTNVFPLAVELQFFMQLRKETADAAPQLNIEIQIHNQDGKLTYGPFIKNDAFIGGHRFAVAVGLIHPIFPAPNEYTITARVTTNGHVSECRYDIDVKYAEPPANNS